MKYFQQQQPAMMQQCLASQAYPNVVVQHADSGHQVFRTRVLDLLWPLVFFNLHRCVLIVALAGAAAAPSAVGCRIGC